MIRRHLLFIECKVNKDLTLLLYIYIYLYDSAKLSLLSLSRLSADYEFTREI